MLFMGKARRIFLLPLILAGCDTAATLFTPIPACTDPQICELLAPAPTLLVGLYDYFGVLKSPEEAREIVLAQGLDPNVPLNFARIGLIEITEQLIAEGRDKFLNQPLGDPTTVGQIFFETNQL